MKLPWKLEWASMADLRGNLSWLAARVVVLRRLAPLVALALFAAAGARAQSNPYDPSDMTAGSSSASGGQTSYQGSAGVQSSSPYGAQPGQAAGIGNMGQTYYQGQSYYPGQSVGGINGTTVFTPPVIQAPPWAPDQSQGADVYNQVTQPVGPPGAIQAPLFARPTATPGQFELFTRKPPEPGEFEAFIDKTLDHPLPRFGATLILEGNRGFSPPSTASVPPDYKLNPGDELIVEITGAVEADLRLTIDREGRIFIPRVGAVEVAGIRYGDLENAISRRLAQQYRQAKVSVVIGRLHGITVYVTGYATTPGAYTVSSLSTMVDAVLHAGGPAAGGSFRKVELRRRGALVTELDLYDLLLRGDKSHDAILENGDVINIAAVGPELAISGSVNAEAIYEAKPGDTLADMIGYAGGPNSLADRSRILVVRLHDLDRAGSEEFTFAQARTLPAEAGDIIRVLSLKDVARPQERQAILATIDGEVDHPGRYYLQPGASVGDLLSSAGGLTTGAFVYGTSFYRDSVRRQQQESFDRAVHDLEVSVTLSPLSAPRSQAAAYQASAQDALVAIQRLRESKPDGRIVLNLPYGSTALPVRLTLEDGDHIHVPPQPTTVGVFGAVYAPGSFVYKSGVRVEDYLRLAGGPRRFADRGEVFVVRASGQVLSRHASHDFGREVALPGDVIFMPVRTTPGPFEHIKEIATIVYQLGLSAAAIGILANQL
jgi:protein involved in polysaccharide export with SLBB domain